MMIAAVSTQMGWWSTLWDPSQVDPVRRHHRQEPPRTILHQALADLDPVNV